MIETERMLLVPLNTRQLLLWANNSEQLQKELDICHLAQTMDSFMQGIVYEQLSILEYLPSNLHWVTFWLLIKKVNRSAIGSACFKAPPNANGETEIGYGIIPAFEGQGYTTEAVNALTAWVLTQPNVKSLLAETEKGNIASQRVLQKNGFTKLCETKDCFLWTQTISTL